MSANGPIDQHLSRFMPIFDDNADLQCKPELDKVFLAEMGKTLTCGDMHANAKKFFYILVRHGFIDVSKDMSKREMIHIDRIKIIDLHEWNAFNI